MIGFFFVYHSPHSLFICIFAAYNFTLCFNAMMEHSSKLMNRAADNIRVLVASMVEKAKSGHPGGAMGGADFINVLYSEFLTFDPKDPTWECRDRFFLDPGHMSPMLYSILMLCGRFTMEDLKQFRQWDSVTPGHPERNVERGIENTSGPLGQGHVYAVGAAIAAKALYARTGNPGFKREKIYATSLMVAFRKRFRKVQVVWPDTWAWIISLCSTMLTISNFLPLQQM